MSLILDGDLGISGVDGTAASPAIRGNDSNTGISYGTDIVTINTGGVARVTTDASGNVGVGVTPSAWSLSGLNAFQVKNAGFAGYLNNAYVTANAYFSGSNWYYVSTGNAGQYIQSSGQHQWYTSPSGTAGNAISFTQAMTLTADGLLGVGTTNPQHRLHIAGGNVYVPLSHSFYTYTVDYGMGTPDAEGLQIFAASGDSIRFGGRSSGVFSEYARFIGGNLLVGATSAYDGSAKIQVLMSGQNTGITTKAGSTSASYAIGFYNPNGVVGGIVTNASATAYNTSSDYRLKENVSPMQNALATVAALKPCTYTWKADGSNGQGFIAHELQAVVPDCVTGEKDAVDAEGKPQYQGVDTSFLVATLVAAIQEQQATIAAMETRLAALEA